MITWSLKIYGHFFVQYHRGYAREKYTTVIHSFMGGTGKNLKIKIYPTCFEKVLRGLQWYVFPLHILYGIGEKKRLQVF